MNANRPEVVRNTPEEEAEIARQLAEDPDTYEWTNEDWAYAVTTEQLFPEAAVNDLRVRLSRGNVITLVNKAGTASQESFAIDQEERRVTEALVMIWRRESPIGNGNATSGGTADGVPTLQRPAL